jgi:hypothetical protein
VVAGVPARAMDKAARTAREVLAAGKTGAGSA